MRVNEALLNDFIRKRIKELRVSKGLTQEQLASAVNISRAAIANYESNNYPIDKLSILYKICAALEVDLSEVLPTLSSIKEKSSPDLIINHDNKLSEQHKEELKDFIEDIDDINRRRK